MSESGHKPTQTPLRFDRGAPRLACQGQHVNEGGGSLARRRFQRGTVFLREIRDEHGKLIRAVWVGRWYEDEIANGKVRRVRRAKILGTKEEFPTKPLAKRELQDQLKDVNNPRYRPRPAGSFADFAARWETTVLVQHKSSTQTTCRSHLRKYIVPFFGNLAVRHVEPEKVQQFISGIQASPKTVRNIYVTLQMLWKSARTWNYAVDDALKGVVLPKKRSPCRFFFTLDEVKRILSEAEEPYCTFYWLAAETGMRAGELCGLRLEDLDLQVGQMQVRQSAWRGRLQEPKTQKAVRPLALSPNLTAHLQDFLRGWRPNDLRLLFASRNGTPWDANLIVKRKLHPLLALLGIRRCGLHAFRRANATLLDRLNVPLKLRQARLGHSDAEMTLGVYTQVERQDDERIAGQLGRILDPAIGPTEREGAAQVGQPLVN
jgi:integrase